MSEIESIFEYFADSKYSLISEEDSEEITSVYDLPPIQWPT